MRTVSIVEVSENVKGRAKSYPYHSLRIVEHEVGGGYYRHSKGAVTLRDSGPRRGTINLRRQWEAELPEIVAKRQGV